jgi:hypothetical protein
MGVINATSEPLNMTRPVASEGKGGDGNLGA